MFKNMKTEFNKMTKEIMTFQVQKMKTKNFQKMAK